VKRSNAAARRPVPPVKSADRKLAPLESAGDWIVGNQWGSVGWSRAQVQILSWLGKHWRFRNAPAATAARMLLCAALEDLPHMESILADAFQKSDRGSSTIGPRFDAQARAFLAERGIA